MKTFGIGIIGIIGIISCCGKQENKRYEISEIEKDVVMKIEVSKIDFYMTSIIRVDCNTYDAHFNTMKSKYIIEYQDSINTLMNIIHNLQKDTSNYRPDVRAKLLIYHKNCSIDTLCMSLVGILVNEESYLVDKELVEIIENLQ